MKYHYLLRHHALLDESEEFIQHDRITYFESTPEAFPPSLIYLLIEKEGQDLKNNGNSHVKLVQHGQQRIVVKEPKGKNKRLQSRLISIFKRSRAFYAAQSLLFVRNASIEASRPLCVLERRRFGMIVYSVIFYEYLEGRAIQKGDFPALADTVKRITDLGYGHSDCHQGNFIYTDHGIAPIDFVLKKNWFGKLFVDFQYLKLFHALPEQEFRKLCHHDNSRIVISRGLFKLKTNMRKLKNHIKSHKYLIILILLFYVYVSIP